MPTDMTSFTVHVDVDSVMQVGLLLGDLNRARRLQMRRALSFALMVVLVVVLLLGLFMQVWVLPSTVVNVLTVFPEVHSLAVPAVIWGVVAIACWQVVALIGLRLVIVVRDHRFNSSSFGLLRAIVGCLLGFIVLVAFAFIALSVMGYSTPAMLGLIAGGLVALIIVVALCRFLGANSVVRQHSRG